MTKEAFYAVAVGRTPGIFSSWDNGAKESVIGYPSARYKKFATKAEAAEFIKLHGKRAREEDDDQGKRAVRPKTTQYKFYAVARGRHGVSGVFTTWAEAEIHVKDYFSAKYKSFPTRAEAEEFITAYKRPSNEAKALLPDPKDASTLVAFCDGSAIGNGKFGCQAAYACVFPHHEDWNVAKKLPSHAKATNNRAEYLAALEAMKRANIEDPSQGKMLYIFSDSMLLIRSLTEWLPSWKRNNWMKADGTSVKNVDLLQQLDSAQGTRNILWQHVKAHTNRKDWKSIWNDKVDQLARNTALGNA